MNAGKEAPDSGKDTTLRVLNEARGCTTCHSSLPLGPKPLVAGSKTSRLLIIGQAPGKVAHTSGVPWSDQSGQRLREWLGLSDEQFYDESLVALMPMGFCYPGTGSSGDMPPRPECAPLWHDKLAKAFKRVELTVYIGQYAFGRYLSPLHATLTDAVAAHASLLPERICLPHPSPRNNIWLKKHPWFASELLPALRAQVGQILAA